MWTQTQKYTITKNWKQFHYKIPIDLPIIYYVKLSHMITSNKFISMQLPIFHTLAVCLVGQEQPPVKVHTQQTAGVKRPQSKMHNNATDNAQRSTQNVLIYSRRHTEHHRWKPRHTRAAHGWGREGQYLRCAPPSVPTNTTPTTTPTTAPTTAGSTLTCTTTAAGGCRLQ